MINEADYGLHEDLFEVDFVLQDLDDEIEDAKARGRLEGEENSSNFVADVGTGVKSMFTRLETGLTGIVGGPSASRESTSPPKSLDAAESQATSSPLLRLASDEAEDDEMSATDGPQPTDENEPSVPPNMTVSPGRALSTAFAGTLSEADEALSLAMARASRGLGEFLGPGDEERAPGAGLESGQGV